MRPPPLRVARLSPRSVHAGYKPIYQFLGVPASAEPSPRAIAAYVRRAVRLRHECRCAAFAVPSSMPTRAAARLAAKIALDDYLRGEGWRRLARAVQTHVVAPSQRRAAAANAAAKHADRVWYRSQCDPARRVRAEGQKRVAVAAARAAVSRGRVARARLLMVERETLGVVTP